MASLSNIFWLGLKELRSLLSDTVTVGALVFAFTVLIYIQATGTTSEVTNASIAFVDEDHSTLSGELFNVFYPPRFTRPVEIRADEVEDAMDKGRFMFVVVIPFHFEHDLRAGRTPAVQVNVDATAMTQAAIGAGYIKTILADRIASFLGRAALVPPQPIDLIVRRRFNPNGISSWFKSVVGMINQISILTIALTGSAVVRDREHGTLEHLLVMPLTEFEIAMSKVWANSLAILVATGACIVLAIRMALNVPFAGSVVLWFVGVLLYLFFATALGIFLGTSSRSMAQFALLLTMVAVVMILLSGGETPVESQPRWMQYITYFLPTRHFVAFSEAIIFRGAGFSAVWSQFLVVGAIGLAFFVYSLAIFRKSIAVSK